MGEIPPQTFRAVDTLKWTVLCCIMLYNYCHVIRCTLHWIWNSFFIYGRSWQSRNHAHSSALNLVFLLYLCRLETANSPQSQSRKNQNNYMSTKIVNSNDHYSVLRFCSLNLVKLYSRSKKYIINKQQDFVIKLLWKS